MPGKRSRKDGDPNKAAKKPRKDPGQTKPTEFPDLPLIKAVSPTKPTYWVRNFDQDYGMYNLLIAQGAQG